MADEPDIDVLRNWLGYSYEKLAASLGVSVPTLWRYRRRGLPDNSTRRLLEMLDAERRAELTPWSTLK